MKTIHYRNLPRLITRALREEILDGRRSPGSRLKQATIAEQFGASLIPVREALRTLAQEGLVTLNPNRGATVSLLSSREIREIFDTRIILESGSLMLSIAKLDEQDLILAETYIGELDEAAEGSRLSELNRKLHSVWYRHSNNGYLLGLINTLHSNIERYMRIYLLEHHNNELSQQYHRKIQEAIARKDIAAACTHLRKHMELARDNLIGALQNISE